MNRSEYFHLHQTSQELIETAFSLNPRAQLRFWELREQDPEVTKALVSVSDDILSGGFNRHSHQLTMKYLDSVKEEIAMLLLSKEFLNNTISSQIVLIAKTQNKALAFHMSISAVALVAVFLCLALLCCSFRFITSRSTSSTCIGTDELSDSHENIYAITNNDMAQILTPNFYSKPQCYL